MAIILSATTDEQPRRHFKTLPNKSTHVNSSYEHHFFRRVLYGIPKPTTKIPSKVLLNSPVSDMTLTSEGEGIKFRTSSRVSIVQGGKFIFNFSHRGTKGIMQCSGITAIISIKIIIIFITLAIIIIVNKAFYELLPPIFPIFPFPSVLKSSLFTCRGDYKQQG